MGGRGALGRWSWDKNLVEPCVKGWDMVSISSLRSCSTNSITMNILSMLLPTTISYDIGEGGRGERVRVRGECEGGGGGERGGGERGGGERGGGERYVTSPCFPGPRLLCKRADRVPGTH